MDDYEKHLTANSIYNNGSKSQWEEAVNIIQISFECCGTSSNPSDEAGISTYGPMGPFPDSCCAKADVGNCDATTIHKKGCVHKVKDWMKKNIALIIVALCCLLIFEIISAVFALCIMKAKQNWERIK